MNTVGRPRSPDCAWQVRVDRLRWHISHAIIQNHSIHRTLDYHKGESAFWANLSAVWASETEETAIWGVYAVL